MDEILPARSERFPEGGEGALASRLRCQSVTVPVGYGASRLRCEAALIAEAEQEIADGKGITGAELERYLAWFVSDEDGPAPGDSDVG